MRLPKAPGPTPAERRRERMRAKMDAASTPRARLDAASDWFRGSVALLARRGQLRAAADAQLRMAEILAGEAEALDRRAGDR